MNAKPAKILKPIPEKEMSEWARVALRAHRRATRKKRAEWQPDRKLLKIIEELRSEGRL